MSAVRGTLRSAPRHVAHQPPAGRQSGGHDANDAGHQQCSGYRQQRQLPRPGYGRSVCRVVSCPSIFPTSTHDKRDGTTFGVGRVAGPHVLDGLASAQRAKVGEAEAERLMPAGGRCCPRGHGATVCDQAQRILRFDSGEPTKRDHPGASHVNHNDPIALYDHGRMPVEQPRSVAHEGEHGTVVQGPRDVGAKDESADGRQHQGNDYDGQDAPKTGAKGSRRLLHAASMTHARGGGADGNPAKD